MCPIRFAKHRQQTDPHVELAVLWKPDMMKATRERVTAGEAEPCGDRFSRKKSCPCFGAKQEQNPRRIRVGVGPGTEQQGNAGVPVVYRQWGVPGCMPQHAPQRQIAQAAPKVIATPPASR